jgi:DNA-binding Xre family transcriptional regulator
LLICGDDLVSVRFLERLGASSLAVARGEKPITMNSLALQAGVAPTKVACLARTYEKAASALTLDLASNIVTVLDCGIEDFLEIIDSNW